MSIWPELERGLETTCAAATQALGEELARRLPPEAVVALHGTLGVGKTTFAQGLARGCGVKQAITSPTFTLYHLFRGERTFLHLDAYRLDSPDQVEALLLEDFLEPPYCLAIEWPERIACWLPPNAFHLDLSILGPDHHRVSLRPSV
jgi:tRNA threonylcarbamoyladenosine biosynthesis protein TsaE